MSDFFNFIPLQSFALSNPPITNKEATALFNIWSNSKNAQGDILIDPYLDSFIVNSLMTKGILKNKSIIGGRTVEITPKGKDIIKHIVLYGEKSAFEKNAKFIDYESIYRIVTNNGNVKIANKQNILRTGTSWFKRSCK